MDWLDIKGHDENRDSLKAMLATGRMPHALLFAGPEGIGKGTLAELTAKAVLCSGDEHKPCGTCESCKLVERGAHPDFLVIRPEGSSIKIDQIRLLQQEASKAPHIHESRVCIIEDAGKMTVQAQNSLLKLLEEPPAGFVFILTTVSLRSLLVTILSRCRTFRFNSLEYSVLTDLLTARGLAPDRARVAARLGGGRMGEALRLVTEDGLSLRDTAWNLITALNGNNSGILWEGGAVFDKLGSKDGKTLLKYFLYIFRDMYLLLSRERQLILNIDLEEKLIEQARYWDEAAIMGALDSIKEAERAFAANANVRLTSEALLLKLINLAQRGKNFANSSRSAL